MGHLVKELTRLKGQTAAEDDCAEMLMKLLAQAKLLQQSPAAHRTLCHPRSAFFMWCIVANIFLGDNLTETSTVTTRPSQPSLAGLLSPQSKHTSAHEGH